MRDNAYTSLLRDNADTSLLRDNADTSLLRDNAYVKLGDRMFLETAEIERNKALQSSAQPPLGHVFEQQDGVLVCPTGNT